MHDKDTNKWLGRYVRVMTAINHRNLQTESLKNGLSKYYFEKMLAPSAKAKIPVLLKYLPYLSEKDINKIERGNHNPAKKALRSLSYRVNSPKHFMDFLSLVLKFHDVTRKDVSQALGATNVNIWRAFKINASNVRPYCEQIAKLLHVSPDFLLKPYQRSLVQGYNNDKQNLLDSVQDRPTLKKVIYKLCGKLNLSVKGVSKKIDMNIPRLIRIGSFNEINSMIHKCAPIFHFTTADLKLLYRRVNSDQFLIIHPESELARKNVMGFIKANMMLRNDSFSSINHRAHKSNSSDFATKNFNNGSAIDVSFLKDYLPYLSFHELVFLSKGNTSPISKLVYRLQKHVATKYDYYRYLLVITTLRGTSISRLSKAMGHDRTYLDTALRTSTKSSGVKILRRLATLVDVKPRILLEPWEHVSQAPQRQDVKMQKPRNKAEMRNYRLLQTYITIMAYLYNKTVPVDVFSKLLLTPHFIIDAQIHRGIPYVSAKGLARIRAHDYAPIKKALLNLGYRVHDHKSLRAYLNFLVGIHETTLSKISIQMNKPRGYIVDVASKGSEQERREVAGFMASHLNIPKEYVYPPFRQANGLIYGVVDRKSLVRIIRILTEKRCHRSLQGLSEKLGRTSSYVSDMILHGSHASVLKLLKTALPILGIKPSKPKLDFLLTRVEEGDRRSSRFKVSQEKYQRLLKLVKIWLLSKDQSITEASIKMGHSHYYINHLLKQYAISNNVKPLLKNLPDLKEYNLAMTKVGSVEPIKQVLNAMMHKVHDRHSLFNYMNALLWGCGTDLNTISMKLGHNRSYLGEFMTSFDEDRFLEIGKAMAKALAMSPSILTTPIKQAFKSDKPQPTAHATSFNLNVLSAVSEIAKQSWMSVNVLSATLYRDKDYIKRMINQGSPLDQYKMLKHLSSVSGIKSKLIGKTLNELENTSDE